MKHKLEDLEDRVQKIEDVFVYDIAILKTRMDSLQEQITLSTRIMRDLLSLQDKMPK